MGSYFFLDESYYEQRDGNIMLLDERDKFLEKYHVH